MRVLLIILLLTRVSFAHVTESEMSIIENIRAASEKQVLISIEKDKESKEAKALAFKAVDGIASIGKMSDQQAESLKTFQKQSDALAITNQKNQDRADKSEITIAKQDTRILQLWVASSVLLVVCIGEAYIILKP